MNLLKFKNSFAGLGDTFYHRNSPTPVSEPAMFLWNASLGESLGVHQPTEESQERFARVFSGNELDDGSQPLSMAYAGHQFGQFNPQLGDGRAHLLGEVEDSEHQLMDVQLKGSGRSRFSRGGDGRCALGPAIREFVMSEAMHALGIPTTRCLAVVTTGELVYRDQALPGAVVTRIAASHLRVGTFEYFSARGDTEALEVLADYAIERHYPHISLDDPDRYKKLVSAVMDGQIALVTQWMRVGFIHGVMNTDNTAISGETIDYGPCAMMSAYNPNTVFSSIDVQGRYAFGNQPAIAQWNTARFAETLLPLVSEDEKDAIEKLGALIGEFPARFEKSYLGMMAAKLGLGGAGEVHKDIIMDLLKLMQQQAMDYTVTFDRLTCALTSATLSKQLSEEMGAWFDQWLQLLEHQEKDKKSLQAAMRRHNPVVIPRNHHMEAVLADCISSNSPRAAEDFLTVLRKPYEVTDNTWQYQDPPGDNDRSYQTFCGT